MSGVRRAGRTRKRLAVLLQEKADELFGKDHFCICPEDIEQNDLYYRTRYTDGISWEVAMEADTAPFRSRFYSWDTMGNCCKHGVGIVGGRDDMGHFELCADEGA